MIREPQYWVVSPDIDGSGKLVDQWKDEILRHHVAIMGWGPDEWRNRNHMGPRFAGKDNPSIQQGDVILVGRSRKRREVVAVGIVDSEYWEQRFPWYKYKVYPRHLEPFKQLQKPPQDLPLERVLPHSKAMTETPLRPGDPDHKAVCDWIQQQLGTRDRTSPDGRTGRGSPRQPDIERRQAVEKAAQKAVEKLYTDQGYELVRDVSALKCGWDLEAMGKGKTLRIEVKGLSTEVPVAELTPNEYEPMYRNDSSYRLCIVTNALHSSACHIHEFSLNSRQRRWTDQEGNQLNIEERKSARVRA